MVLCKRMKSLSLNSPLTFQTFFVHNVLSINLLIVLYLVSTDLSYGAFMSLIFVGM
jgi:hypothetical protein